MRLEIEKYLKQIESNLYTCPRKKRNVFLRDLRGNIDAYSVYPAINTVTFLDL